MDWEEESTLGSIEKLKEAMKGSMGKIQGKW